MFDHSALKIYIDGSASKNPGGKGGLSGVAVFPEDFDREDKIIFKKSFNKTNNNRMELQACLCALDYVVKNAKKLGVNRAIIVTDSMYVVENQGNIYNWRKDGWQNQHGRPIENQDLWKQFISLKSRVPIPTDITWKLGKSDEVTKKVDKLAKAETKKISKPDFGFIQGKVSRIKSEIQGAASLFPAKGQIVNIRVCRYSASGDAKTKVFFEVLSQDLSSVTSKNYAYAPRGIADAIHRWGIYKAEFNSDTNYPIIETIEALEVIKI